MSVFRNTGPLGEELTVKFLMKRGHKILDRNFRRPWGELDIVSKKAGVIHFVEVKSTSSLVSERASDRTRRLERVIATVTRETVEKEQLHGIVAVGQYKRKTEDRHRPEDNVHPAKIKRLKRIIQTYLDTRHVSDETNWKFHVATVYIDSERKRAKINFLEDLIL